MKAGANNLLAEVRAKESGVVFLTYMAWDKEIGDEVERIDVVPCRRCAAETSAGAFVG